MPPRVVNQFMAKIFVLHLLLAFYNKYADKKCLGPIMKIPTMVIGFAIGLFRDVSMKDKNSID